MKIKYGDLPEIDLPELNAEIIPTAESLLAPVLASYLGPQAGQKVGIVGAGCGLAAVICLFRGAKVMVVEPQEDSRRRWEKTKAANRPRGNGGLSIRADTNNFQDSDSQLDLLLYLGTESVSLGQAIKLGERLLRSHGRLLLFAPSKRAKEEAEKLLGGGWTGVKVLESQSWGRNGDYRYVIEACHTV